jgi:hypothetical protein
MDRDDTAIEGPAVNERDSQSGHIRAIKGAADESGVPT